MIRITLRLLLEWFAFLKQIFLKVTSKGSLLRCSLTYWHFNDNFHRYFAWLEDLSMKSKQAQAIVLAVRVIQVILLLQVIQKSCVIILKISPFWRLINFDYIQMVTENAPATHLILIFIELMSIGFFEYAFIFDYHAHAQYIAIPGEILKGNGWYFPVDQAKQCAKIRKIIRFCYNLTNFGVPFAYGSFILVTQYSILKFTLENLEYFFKSISGLITFTCMHLNVLHFYACAHLVAFIIVLACSYSWYYTFIVFTRIRLLARIYPKSGIKTRRVTWSSINVFMACQMTTLQSVFSFNAIYGRIFLLFLIFNFPSATYFVHMVRDRRTPAIFLAFFLFLLFYQTLYIFIFHLMAAMYVSRLNGVDKRLIAWNAVLKRPYENIKCSSYITLYQSGEKYGITYGGIALVTWLSFLKFGFGFGQYVMLMPQLV